MYKTLGKYKTDHNRKIHQWMYSTVITLANKCSPIISDDPATRKSPHFSSNTDSSVIHIVVIPMCLRAHINDKPWSRLKYNITDMRNNLSYMIEVRNVQFRWKIILFRPEMIRKLYIAKLSLSHNYYTRSITVSNLPGLLEIIFLFSFHDIIN